MWLPSKFAKGWTAVDVAADLPVWCAASVHTAAGRDARPVVQAFAELPNPGADAEAAAVRELLQRTARGYPVVVTLARANYRTQVMPEPSVPDREMATSLRWSAAADDGGSPEDMNLTWLRIPTAAAMPARPRQVYTFTTSRVWQAAQLALWRQARLRPSALDVRETALRNLAALVEQGDSASALVAADAAGVALVFTWHGALFLDRYLELPLADWRGQTAEARGRHLDRLAELVTRSAAHLARHYPFMTVDRVTVAPAVEPADLAEALGQRLALPVRPLPLDRLFDLAAVPELARAPALQARALVSLGAALRGLKAR